MSLPDGAKKTIIALKLAHARLAILAFFGGVKTWYYLFSLAITRNEDASRWGPLPGGDCFATRDGPEDYDHKRDEHDRFLQAVSVLGEIIGRIDQDFHAGSMRNWQSAVVLGREDATEIRHTIKRFRDLIPLRNWLMSNIPHAKTSADLASQKAQLEQVWFELAEIESVTTILELDIVESNMKQEAVSMALNYMRQYAESFVKAVETLAQCENFACL